MCAQMADETNLRLESSAAVGAGDGGRSPCTGIGINKIRDSGLTKDNTDKGSHLGFRRNTPATTQNQVYSPVLVDKSN